MRLPPANPLARSIGSDEGSTQLPAGTKAIDDDQAVRDLAIGELAIGELAIEERAIEELAIQASVEASDEETLDAIASASLTPATLAR